VEPGGSFQKHSKKNEVIAVGLRRKPEGEKIQEDVLWERVAGRPPPNPGRKKNHKRSVKGGGRPIDNKKSK